MEASTTSMNIKILDFESEEQKFKVKLQIIKNHLCALLYINNSLICEGFISLKKIQCQIGAFDEYNIKDIYKEINLLKNDDFILIKEKDEYMLIIKFMILRKEKKLYIDLKQTDNILNDDLINEICQLKEIIKKKDEEINYLKKYNQINNELDINSKKDIYNNFLIQLKEPIHQINFNKR